MLKDKIVPFLFGTSIAIAAIAVAGGGSQPQTTQIVPARYQIVKDVKREGSGAFDILLDSARGRTWRLVQSGPHPLMWHYAPLNNEVQGGIPATP